MGVALGLVVAVAFGTGDFLGGLASRRVAVLTAVLVSQALGLVVIVIGAAVLSHDATVEWRDVALGAGVGFATVVGLAFLYRGLAIGRASVVAPVTAVGAATLQVVWGITNGEAPGAVALIGTALALTAIAIVAGASGEAPDAHEPHRASRALEVGLAAGAAVCLGAVTILLSETGGDSGLWPVVVARSAPLPALVVVLALTGAPILAERSVLPLLAGAGALDAVANAVLLVAVREDLVSLVAPVAALAPAATVVLARLVHHERMGHRRAIGIGIAFVGLVLIAVR